MSKYPDDADGSVLADLEASGIDMSAPLQFEFPVAVPDEESAEKTYAAMVAAGYDSVIEFDEGEPDEDGEIDPDDDEFGPCWTVYANVVMVPNYDELIRIQADLDRIAEPFGGASDGWGALVGDEGEDEEDEEL
jgi:regulator of RNase E activity RraB